MKRKSKVFAGILIVIATIVVSKIYYNQNHFNALSDLLLENTEALANGEDSRPVLCTGSGSVYCPITHTKVKFVAYAYSLE